MIEIDDNIIEFINVQNNQRYKNVFFNGIDTYIEVSIEDYMDTRFMEDFESFAQLYIQAGADPYMSSSMRRQAKSEYIHRKIMYLIADKYPHLIL